jgi:hypothetical protein
MARRPPIGRCVHCLSENVPRTWDHIFPRSWYPDTTPANLYKWQAPACFACNNRLGQIEQELLRGLAMCLDPNNPASASVTRSVLRSMQPSATDDDREKQRREQVGRRFTATLVHGKKIPAEAAEVNHSTEVKLPKSERTAVTLPVGHVHTWLEKTVRGMLHYHGQRFVEPSYAFDFMPFLTRKALAGFEESMAGLGVTYVNGPGIAVRMGVAAEDEISSVFVIQLWEQLYMGAAVQPRELGVIASLE